MNRTVDARPLVVVEGPPAGIEGDIRAARDAGFEVLRGFRGGPPSPRPGAPMPRVGSPARRGIVRAGIVANARDAADALLAALDGSGLVIAATADRTTIDRLVDDLRRLGAVDHRSAPPPRSDDAPALTVHGRAILGLLAEGLSLGEAAHELGLARRTADRRLADARRALGVERTTEAIARARRLGWLSPADATDD